MTRRVDRECGRKTARADVLAREIRREIDAWKGFEAQRGVPLVSRMMAFDRALKLVLPDRTIVVGLVLALLLCFSVAAQAAVLDYRVAWDPNTEPDMREYRVYRVDGPRLLLGTVQHPTVEFPFSITVPDNASGTVTVVVTAVDTSNNESADSLPASDNWTSLDTVPPAPPQKTIIIKTVVTTTTTISVP
jgi:hypothetical protein